MGLMKSLVEITHDDGYGDLLLMHINHAFAGKDMRAERVFGPVALSVKIEKPKRYRPFANAAEFLAHPLSGDWIDVGSGQFSKVQDCSDNGIWFSGDEDIQLYEDAIADLRFRDGTPFGVEVTE